MRRLAMRVNHSWEVKPPISSVTVLVNEDDVEIGEVASSPGPRVFPIPRMTKGRESACSNGTEPADHLIDRYFHCAGKQTSASSATSQRAVVESISCAR